MIKQIEKFYSQEPASSENAFEAAIQKLEAEIAKGTSLNDMKTINNEINDILKNYYQVIILENQQIESKAASIVPENIIDDKITKDLLSQGENITQEKITHNKNYENVKTNEKKDKRNILILFIVNIFLLIVLLFGCYLVLQGTKIDIKDFTKKSNKRNNANNNTSSLTGL